MWFCDGFVDEDVRVMLALLNCLHHSLYSLIWLVFVDGMTLPGSPAFHLNVGVFLVESSKRNVTFASKTLVWRMLRKWWDKDLIESWTNLKCAKDHFIDHHIFAQLVWLSLFQWSFFFLLISFFLNVIFSLKIFLFKKRWQMLPSFHFSSSLKGR